MKTYLTTHQQEASCNILRSDDRGATWNELYRTTEGVFTVSFVDGENGRAFGHSSDPFGPFVYRTSDGGHTRACSFAELPAYIRSASFADEEVGFAVTHLDLDDSCIYGAEDGGKTGECQFGVDGQLIRIHAVAREVGTTVGRWGCVLRTEAGGVATDREAGPVFPDVPATVSLDQNYPNPFNPTTAISYALPRLSEVSLTVYDMLGRPVSVLASGAQPAGSHEVTFDATGLPSGVYLYRLQAGEYGMAKRMVVMK